MRGMSRTTVILVWAGPLAAMFALTACQVNGNETRDKAGGVGPIVTLRLGTVDPQGKSDSPSIEHFAQRVKVRSGGRLRIDVQWDAAPTAPDFEQAIVRMVSGEVLDLGWIGSRAWDTQGVLSLQALQAPFLITDNRLLAEVTQGPMADDMLAGLGGAGVTGLGLFPDRFRHPVGFQTPLVSLRDFKGVKIRVPMSNASDALIRALGAEPAHLSGDAYDTAVHDGTLAGVEASVELAANLQGQIVTGNIVFYPRVDTLFMSNTRLSSLTKVQREILRAAAQDTLQFAQSGLPTAEDAQAFCDGGGRVVAASKADVDAIVAAAQPVYRKLESDPQTKKLIAGIRRLKDRLAQPTVVPHPCGSPTPGPSPNSVAIPDGSYLVTATKQQALRADWSDPCALRFGGARLRLELRNGRYTQWESCAGHPEEVNDLGTYRITSSNRVSLENPDHPGPTILAWSYDRNVLTLRVLRAGATEDPGAERFFLDHAWAKVG